MTKNKIQTWKLLYILILVSSFLVHVVCQEEDEVSADKFGNSSAATAMFSQYASKRFTNLSSSLKDDIQAKFSFCITDVYVLISLFFFEKFSFQVDIVVF